IHGLIFHNDALPIKGVVPHNLRMPVNQMEGIQQDIPRTIAMMPVQTREDYENIVLRLEHVGPLVEQTIALMEQGLGDRMTPSRITLRNLPGQVTGQIFDDPMKSPLLETFSKMPASVSGSDQAILRQRAINAYKNLIAPAFTKFHHFLISRYLPACREATAAV